MVLVGSLGVSGVVIGVAAFVLFSKGFAHFFVLGRLVEVLFHQQLVRVLEDVLNDSIRVDSNVVVEVQGPQNHVGKHEVFELVSLFDLSKLELLLVVYVGQDIVSGVALNLLHLFAALFFGDLGSIGGSKQLNGVFVDTLDTEHVIRVNLGGIPYLLVVACEALPEGREPFVDIIGHNVSLEFHITAFHANEFDALDYVVQYDFLHEE